MGLECSIHSASAARVMVSKSDLNGEYHNTSLWSRIFISYPLALSSPHSILMILLFCAVMGPVTKGKKTAKETSYKLPG